MAIFPHFVDPISTSFQDPITVSWRNCIRNSVQHHHALQSVMQQNIPYPGGEGEGILYVGGGVYWPGIVVGIRLLREVVKCKLPVQVWYRGDDEPIDPKDIEGMDVELIDSKAMAAKLGDARILGGWESKLYAITHTQFKRLLYLDADAYLVGKPDHLFFALDNYGFIFWQDLSGSDNAVKWNKVWPHGDGGVPAIQGGQLFIDREKVWKSIAVAHWINQHSDFYYGHMYGDQDAWRVAFAATKEPVHNLGRADWKWTAFVCNSGRPIVVHRCRGKLFRPQEVPPEKQTYNSPQWGLPLESTVFQMFTQYVSQEQRSAEEAFSEIYKRKIWGDGSGPGSKLKDEAIPYVRQINFLAKLLDWKSCTDAGCGDGVVASHLKIHSYIGVDVYPEIIETNRKQHPFRLWKQGDFYTNRDLLKPADVLLCKDVLHHWPNDWVVDFVRWAIQSQRWKWIVFTQDVHQQHDDQNTYLGGYRPLHPHMRPMMAFEPNSTFEYLHKLMMIFRTG